MRSPFCVVQFFTNLYDVKNRKEILYEERKFFTINRISVRRSKMKRISLHRSNTGSVNFGDVILCLSSRAGIYKGV